MAHYYIDNFNEARFKKIAAQHFRKHLEDMMSPLVSDLMNTIPIDGIPDAVEEVLGIREDLLKKIDWEIDWYQNQGEKALDNMTTPNPTEDPDKEDKT